MMPRNPRRVGSQNPAINLCIGHRLALMVCGGIRENATPGAAQWPGNYLEILMTKDRQRLLLIAINKMPSAEKAKADELSGATGKLPTSEHAISLIASGDPGLAMGSVKRLVALPINKPR